MKSRCRPFRLALSRDQACPRPFCPYMHWNTSDQGGSDRILRFTISLAFFCEYLAVLRSLWSGSTRSPMIACEHTRWAHLILQDYHALAPSVLRALSVKPRPARSVFGWILVEPCTVLIMPVLLEFHSWTGGVIGRCSHLGFV